MGHHKLVVVGLLAVVAVAVAQNNFRPNNNFRQNNNFRPQNTRNNNGRFISNNNNNNGRFVSNNNNNNGRFVSNNNNRPAPVNNNNRFVSNNNNAVRTNNNNNNVIVNRNPVIRNGFRATPSNARDRNGDEVYPGCNGTVCLPVANLCAQRKRKAGHFNFGGKSYWVSWASDENNLRNARWNWFTGRNYCRKMCMDMVSFETKAEQDFVEELMKFSNVEDVHNAGRLCDKEVEGCEDNDRFLPLNINGWFWASTLRMMPPTNLQRSGVFNNWAPGQPDGRIKADGFGTEACTALLLKNGVYKWYDEPCNTRRQIICEDLPTPNINFVRNNNPGVNIP